MKVIILVFLLFLSKIAIFSQDPYSGEYEIRRVSKTPVLDGVLETNFWPNSAFKEFIARYCTPMLKLPTKAALVMDDTFLYIAIQAGNNLSEEFNGKPREYDDPKIFEDDAIEILFHNNDAVIYHHIVINFYGAIYDSFARIERGETEISWNSGLSCAISKTTGLLNQRTLEIKIPLKNLNINPKEPKFRFNISRSQKKIIKATPIKPIIKDGKETKPPPKVLDKIITSESAFFPTGENNNVYSAFGYATFKHKKDLVIPNEQQILLGYCSQIASIDVYFKAVNEYMGLIPEGCEVGHGATLRHHDHIPVSQLPIKMDGYLRTYTTTKIPEYLSMGNQILDKFEKLLTETKDSQDRNWLPYWDLVDTEGKAHGYDKGPDNTRLRMAIPFNQSKAKFTLAGNKFIDSFGYGFYQVSLIKKELPITFNARTTQFLRQMIDFYHREYILFDKNDKYYWRTTDFTPGKPEPIEEKYISWLLGTDIIYLMLAYLNYESNDATSKLCLASLKKFSDFYILERKKLGQKNRANSDWTNKPLWRIEYLDNRMVSVAEWVESKRNIDFELLVQFIKKDLKNLYAYDQKVLFAEDGSLDWSDSSTQLLNVYACINPEQYKVLLKGFVHGAMTPRGALPKGVQIQGMNSSSYPLFLTYAHAAWQKKIIDDEDLKYVTNKLYQFFGTGEALRNETDWVNELLPVDKSMPHWRASPDDNYVNNVMSEGLWKNSEAHGYCLNWTIYNSGSKHQPYYESSLNRIFRNDYIQFTAPFQSHAEPYAYGNSFTFNTLKYISHVKTENSIKVVFEKPDLPDDLLCFGVLDVTAIYYSNKNLMYPTPFAVTNVICRQKNLLHKIIGCTEINKEYSGIDNKKVVFILPKHPKGQVEVEIQFNKVSKFLEVPEGE